MAEHRTLLRPAEVGQRLGISTSTARRWIRSGRIKGVPLGRLVGVPVAEVERVAREGVGSFRRAARTEAA